MPKNIYTETLLNSYIVSLVVIGVLIIILVLLIVILKWYNPILFYDLSFYTNQFSI